MSLPDELSALAAFVMETPPNNPRMVWAGMTPEEARERILFLRSETKEEMDAALAACGFIADEAGQFIHHPTLSFEGIVVGRLLENRQPDENGEYDPPLEYLPGWHVNLLPMEL